MKYNIKRIKKRKGIKFAQGQIANVHGVHVWVSVCTVSWFVVHMCVHTKYDSLCTLKCACMCVVCVLYVCEIYTICANLGVALNLRISA